MDSELRTVSVKKYTKPVWNLLYINLSELLPEIRHGAKPKANITTDTDSTFLQLTKRNTGKFHISHTCYIFSTNINYEIS